MKELVCELCGSHGEGGEIEYADGKRKHFTADRVFKDGKPHPIMCGGKFVKAGSGREGAGT